MLPAAHATFLVHTSSGSLRLCELAPKLMAFAWDLYPACACGVCHGLHNQNVAKKCLEDFAHTSHLKFAIWCARSSVTMPQKNCTL